MFAPLTYPSPRHGVRTSDQEHRSFGEVILRPSPLRAVPRRVAEIPQHASNARSAGSTSLRLDLRQYSDAAFE
jgi:hypothetical protein